MARAQVSDFLSNFRFHVVVNALGGQTLDTTINSSSGQISAGFNACSAPSITEDAVEYREGHYIYSRKFTGIPTVADVTLSRGVALSDGTMFSWIKDVVEGNNEYRADVYIYHFAREAKPQSTSGTTNTQMSVNLSQGGYIQYFCQNAFPIEHKVSGDFDATSSEISIQELGLAMEAFDSTIVQPLTP